ncbi:MAG: glycerophosphodiester phosphodiesterase [Pseudomonadales bacterium]
MERLHAKPHGNRLRTPILALTLTYVAYLPAVDAAVPAAPLIAAHRGTTTGAPENTLAAIRWASDFGADLIEADLRMSADGALVLMHDDDVSRTTNGAGRVRDLSLGQLQGLDAGAGERVPTLTEAMVLLSNRPQRLLLDVKTGEPGLAPRLVEAVAAHGFERRVLVGVRSVDLLKSLRSLSPELELLAMAPKPTDIKDFLEHRPQGVRLWARWAQSDPDLARTVRSRGAQVWIMSGDRHPVQLRELFAVADGFITDLPLELRRFALLEQDIRQP